MGRVITTIAHLITILGGILATLALFSAISRSATGENGLADLVLACTLVIVPYCIAGSLHRIVMLGRDEEPAPPISG